MTTASVRSYVEQFERLRNAAGVPPIQSPYGYILEHGKQYPGPQQEPVRRLGGRLKRAPKRCFQNAFDLSERDSSLYGVFDSWWAWEDVLNILKTQQN